jgi:hypothetical protein
MSLSLDSAAARPRVSTALDYLYLVLTKMIIRAEICSKPSVSPVKPAALSNC